MVSPPPSRAQNDGTQGTGRITRKRAATTTAEPEDKAVKVPKKDLKPGSGAVSSTQPVAARTRQRPQPGAKSKATAAMVKDDDTDAMIG